MPRPVSNPPNPWQSTHVEWIGPPPEARLEVYEETAKEVVAENDSPDIGYRYSVNPYRGCFHGCAYCYARPYHHYLDMGAGTDFDRKIVVKVNAPEALERRFRSRGWRGDRVAFSGVTDCYQPLEASYEITRRCLEVCLAYRNPVGVITKGLLVRRDADVLGALAREARASVFMTIPFTDARAARQVEPWAPPPAQRLEALRILADHGVETGVGVAPVIPGLNDDRIPEVLERAREVGVKRAFISLLRLPEAVLPVFTERMQEVLSPERLRKVMNGVSEMRDGNIGEARFGARMCGSGPRWKLVVDLFHSTCRRLGIEAAESGEREEPPTTFHRPGETPGLFD